MSTLPLIQHMGKQLFFIIGCARSGTTSLSLILDKATNATCLMEPAPNFCRESRLFWEGKLSDPEKTLHEILEGRIRRHSTDLPIYGEKNIALYVFVEILFSSFGSKLIYITRDGRDCVASMRQWHQDMWGNMYREGLKQPPLTLRAQKVIANLPVKEDEADFSRPRPLPGDPWYAQWSEMTHHQMLCWYWNACNMHILDQLDRIPSEYWQRVDYSHANVCVQILSVIDFLGLEGISAAVIDQMLGQRINSVRQRTGKDIPSPSWRNWTDEELDQFWELCTPAMKRLGYLCPIRPEERRFTPDYGQWWMSNEVTHAFFEEIYKDRIYQHRAFEAWAEPLLKRETIATVLEVACGHGIGYADFFKNIAYTGMDISPKEIAWCKEHHNNPRHQWLCEDFILSNDAQKYDLVFCQGSIENVYDMDAFIRKMALVAKKYVYLAGFLGYNDSCLEHSYVWNERYTSYSNIFSLRHAKEVLLACGFSRVSFKRIATNKEGNPYESILIAEK